MRDLPVLIQSFNIELVQIKEETIASRIADVLMHIANEKLGDTDRQRDSQWWWL
jgi:hypothetical protein